MSSSSTPAGWRYDIAFDGLGWRVVDTSIQGPTGGITVHGTERREQTDALKIAHQLNHTSG